MRRARSTLLAVALLKPTTLGCNEFHVIPSCNDGVKNGAETDTDCGGDACTRCALGRACADQSDCYTGNCISGFCTPPEVGLWTPVPVPAPNARHGHAMSHDGTATLLFGGNDPVMVYGDTWRFDGKSWAPESPGTPPTPRTGAPLVYDIDHLRAVLFAGTDLYGNPIGDTWSWDTKTWSSVTAAMAPPGRIFSAIAYDSDHGEFVMFGGFANGAELGDTWIWTGGSWQQLGAAGPPSRHAAAMAYDEARKRAVLFGGTVGAGINLDDTWTWDGATWNNASPDAGASGGPDRRNSVAMAYDRARARIIMFGGVGDGNAVYGDTWEWDGSAWQKPAVMGGPQGRYRAAMAYDPTRGRIVLFGGTPDGVNPLDDTWEYHQHGNPCRSDDACDTGHCVDGLCCESDRCNACETCNNPSSPGVCTSCGAACADAGACAP
jgi:hypothetical protein